MPISARGAVLFGVAIFDLVAPETINTQVIALNVLLAVGGGLPLVGVAQHDEMVFLTERTPPASFFRLRLLLSRVMAPRRLCF